MTNGNSCERITTKEDCEAAATTLGLSDSTTALVVPADQGNYAPPYCSYMPGYNGDKLYFNPAFNSPDSCSNEENCLCKIGKTSFYQLVLQLAVENLRFHVQSLSKQAPLLDTVCMLW